MKPSKILGFAIGPIGSAFFAIVSLPVVTWFYSAQDVGRLAMLQVSSSLCVILFSLGLDQAYVREYHGEKDRSKLLVICIVPGLTLLILLGVFVFSFEPTAISVFLYEEPSELLSFVTLIAFISALCSRLFSLVLRMQEKAIAFSLSHLMPKVVFLLIIVGLALINFQADLKALLIAHVLSMLSIALFLVYVTRSDWYPISYRRSDLTRARSLLGFGMPLIIGGLCSWGLHFTDKLYLKAFSDFTQLGIYSVATSIAAGATILASIFNTVWSPVIYKWLETGIDNKRYDDMAEHILAAAFYIFVAVGSFSWVIPYLLPPAYSNIHYMLTVCVAAPLLYALSETTGIGINIVRKTKYSMMASLLAVMVSLAANYFLVPRFGAFGAAASTAMAFWFFMVLRTEFSCLVWRRLPRIKLYSSTLSCVVFSIWLMFEGSNKQEPIFLLWLIFGLVGGLVFRSSLISLFWLLNNTRKSLGRVR